MAVYVLQLGLARARPCPPRRRVAAIVCHDSAMSGYESEVGEGTRALTRGRGAKILVTPAAGQAEEPPVHE